MTLGKGGKLERAILHREYLSARVDVNHGAHSGQFWLEYTKQPYLVMLLHSAYIRPNVASLWFPAIPCRC